MGGSTCKLTSEKKPVFNGKTVHALCTRHTLKMCALRGSIEHVRDFVNCSKLWQLMVGIRQVDLSLLRKRACFYPVTVSRRDNA